MGIYNLVGFPSESILTLLPKYSLNLSGDCVWMGIIVAGFSALVNAFSCCTPACPLVWTCMGEMPYLVPERFLILKVSAPHRVNQGWTLYIPLFANAFLIPYDGLTTRESFFSSISSYVIFDSLYLYRVLSSANLLVLLSEVKNTLISLKSNCGIFGALLRKTSSKCIVYGSSTRIRPLLRHALYSDDILSIFWDEQAKKIKPFFSLKIVTSLSLNSSSFS